MATKRLQQTNRSDGKKSVSRLFFVPPNVPYDCIKLRQSLSGLTKGKRLDAISPNPKRVYPNEIKEVTERNPETRKRWVRIVCKTGIEANELLKFPMIIRLVELIRVDEDPLVIGLAIKSVKKISKTMDGTEKKIALQYLKLVMKV